MIFGSTIKRPRDQTNAFVGHMRLVRVVTQEPRTRRRSATNAVVRSRGRDPRTTNKSPGRHERGRAFARSLTQKSEMARETKNMGLLNERVRERTNTANERTRSPPLASYLCS